MSMHREVSVKLATSAAQIDPIAARFSAAAKHYQAHNCLQRLSALSLQQGFSAKGNLLDIGAGPGTVFDGVPSAAADNEVTNDDVANNNGANDHVAVYALDIALGMLQQLKGTFPDYCCVCGNAEQLPFANGTIDTIYSNLALQWCHNFSAATAEMARVLKADGECHLSIVADGSLEQLSRLGLRLNGFLPLERLQAAFEPRLWQVMDIALVPMTVHFDDLKSLLYSIKGVGASVQSSVLGASAMDRSLVDADTGKSLASNTKVSKLRGRQDWLALQRRAELLREAQGIPLTYQIAQLRMRRCDSV